MSSPLPPSRIRGRLLPITLSQAMGLACGLLGVALTTRWVPPAALGLYGLFMSLAPLGMWVFHAGLVKSVTRLWASSPDQAGLLREVGNAALARSHWFLLMVVVCAVLAAKTNWPAFAPLLLVAALALSVAAVCQAALQADRSHWQDFWVSATGSISRSLLPPLLYLGVGAWFALPLGYTLHALCFALAGILFVRGHTRTSQTATGPQLPTIYAGTLFLAVALGHWALTGLNRWLVWSRYGPDFAGQFTLAGNIALLPTSMLGVMAIQFAQPTLYALADGAAAKPRELARRIDLLAALFTVLALVGLWLLQEVLPLLVGTWIGERYTAATSLVVANGAFTLAIMLANMFQMLLLAVRKEASTGWVDLSGAALLIALTLGVGMLASRDVFLHWLVFTPLIPWLFHRTLARYHAFRMEGGRK